MPAARRDLVKHFVFWLVFFAAIILVKRYFSLFYIPFVIGGLIGVILPDLDHLLYVYFIRPQDLSSQRVNYLVNKNELMRSVELLYETRSERRDLVFHTVLFQGIFFVLMFWMLTSSDSLLGRGLVLSFMLHLSVDQFVDLKSVGNIDSWFKYLPFKLDPDQAKIYWISATALIIILGFMM